MCLKDKLTGPVQDESRNQLVGHKIKEHCKRYNKGKCSFGAWCKYEH